MISLLPELVSGGIDLLGTLWSNHASAAAAQRAMDFEREMSDTALQRGVADATRAGINPMMVASRGGASTPTGIMATVQNPGQAFTRGVSSAAQAREARQRTLESRAREDYTVGQESRANALLYHQMDLIDAQKALAERNVERLKLVMPTVFEAAKAEIERTMSSARAARAGAALDEAAETGAANVQKFEADLGEAGPMVRFFFEALRGLGGVKWLR